MRDGDVDDTGPLARLAELEARLTAGGPALPAALRAECTQALQAIAYHAERGGQHQVAARARRMLARLGA